MLNFISMIARGVHQKLVGSEHSKQQGLNLSRIGAAVLLSGVLTACGGGGGDNPVFGGDSSGGDTTGGATTGGDTAASLLKIGNGVGSGFVEGVIQAGDVSLSAGESTTLTVNIVDGNNTQTSSELSVTFSSDCLALGRAMFSEESVTTSSGRATTTYSDNGCASVGAGKTDTVIASVVVDGVTIQASVDISIEATNVISVQYVGATATSISLKGSGGNETSEVTFKLVGAQGVPIVAESVDFSLSNSIGGVQLVGATGGSLSKETDVNGQVKVTLQSGSVATTTKVIAVHPTSGVRGESGSIVVSTGLPVANRFSLSVSAFNPPNAHDTDGISVDLTVIASDQFGNNVPDGTQISFWSPESGNIGNACSIVSGSCSVQWRSSSPRPSDMRLSIIAYANGAEEFTDKNGNNIYDTGDNFSSVDDLSEPFVDEDESGSYETTEKFVDVNKNGTRDGPNGEWDGPCLDEAEPNAICLGSESLVISDSAVIVMSYDSARIISASRNPGSTVDVSGGAVTISVELADTNAFADNPLPLGTIVTFATDNGKIFAGSSSEVPNTTRPTVHSVLIGPDDTSDVGLLTMTVTAPDGTESVAFWSIQD